MHYPAEFMAAQLTSQAADVDKTVLNLNECRRMGIKILPVDIHKSAKGYLIEEWTDDDGDTHLGIRMGIESIKGIGGGVVDTIKEHEYITTGTGEMIHAPYRNFDDFISRVPKKTVNKNYVELLIRAGVFDTFEPNRYKLLNHYFFNIRKDKQYQGTIEKYFEMKKQKDKALKPKSNEYPVHNPMDYDEDVMLEMEKQSVGTFVSGHPLGELPYKPWSSLSDGEEVKLGGKIVGIRQHKTKGKGDLMCFVKLETQAETLDVTLFPKQYAKYEDRIYKGNVVIVKGTKQAKNGREGILADSVLLSKKKKHRVENPDGGTASVPDVKKEKKDRQFFNEDELPTLTPKEDPLAALFGGV